MSRNCSGWTMPVNRMNSWIAFRYIRRVLGLSISANQSASGGTSFKSWNSRALRMATSAPVLAGNWALGLLYSQSDTRRADLHAVLEQSAWCEAQNFTEIVNLDPYLWPPTPKCWAGDVLERIEERHRFDYRLINRLVEADHIGYIDLGWLARLRPQMNDAGSQSAVLGGNWSYSELGFFRFPISSNHDSILWGKRPTGFWRTL